MGGIALRSETAKLAHGAKLSEFPGQSPMLELKRLQHEMSSMQREVICAFTELLDLKDLNTGAHSTRLAEWAVRVAHQLAVEPGKMRDIEIAAMLHDIGKIGVPDAILRKPGRLDDDEMALMRKHPEYGWAILKNLPGFERASLYILHHHEAFDGSGYPGNLKGSEIPVPSRIVAVIDSFDAMISSRPYREGLPFDEALQRLRQCSGTQFDPEVLACFLEIVGHDLPSVISASGTSPAAAL